MSAQASRDRPVGPRKRVNLALQGGGAHGAFTWGVLDALLQDGRLEIEGLSGTSAGAMNAAVLMCGFAGGGPEVARTRLAGFWKAVSVDGGLGAGHRVLLDLFLGTWRWAPGGSASWLPLAAPSPSTFNPLDINPLRDVVAEHIDFEALRRYEPMKLFIAATNVQTGKVRVFRRDELTMDMLMASAALPALFKAVTVEGTPYWDGGYMGNPVLFPFFNETQTEDIILIQINPILRSEVPVSAQDIQERVNEITFNASLLHEFRAIDFVRRLIDQGRLKETHYKRIRLHRIEENGALEGLGASSKLKAEWGFFQELHALGVKAGRRFLKKHFDMIGVEGTLDLRAELA